MIREIEEGDGAQDCKGLSDEGDEVEEEVHEEEEVDLVGTKLRWYKKRKQQTNLDERGCEVAKVSSARLTKVITKA